MRGLELASQAHLRQVRQDTEAILYRLLGVRSCLPAAPEEASADDYVTHPEGPAGLRIEIDDLIDQCIRPALQRLLRMTKER